MFQRINWFLASLWIVMILASFQSSAEQDLFHHRAFMPEGPHKGQELDTSKKRAVVILQDTRWAREYGLEANTTLVANIFHNGKFYVARVPKKGVQKTYFASEPFGGIFAHSMLRFEFAEDQLVKLIAEVPTPEQAKGRELNLLKEPIFLQDLLLSVEVTVRKGESNFSPTKGLLHLNGLVYRMISLTGRGVTPYIQNKKKVYDTALNLTEEESNRALEISLRTSHEAGMCQMYNTLIKNCNVFAYRILNQARPFMDPDHSILENTAGAVAAVLNEVGVFSRIWPSFGKFGLFWRGFVDLAAPGGSFLNNHPRFVELAKQYECEKALLAADESNTAEPIKKVQKPN